MRTREAVDGRSPPDFRRLAERFRQVSELSRVRMILAIGEGERAVGEITVEVGSSMTAVSRHLAMLRQAQVVSCRAEGQRHFYSLSDAGRALLRAVLAAGGGLDGEGDGDGDGNGNGRANSAAPQARSGPV